MILVYDGTFEGFLSLVYEVYYEKLKPIKIISLDYKFAGVTIFSVFSPREDALKQIGRQQPTEMEK